MSNFASCSSLLFRFNVKSVKLKLESQNMLTASSVEAKKPLDINYCLEIAKAIVM